MSNVGVELFSGYTPYFSFVTGFEPAANITGTTLDNLGVSGYGYNVFFADGSRLDIRLNEGGTTDAQPPTFDNLTHYSFSTIAGGFRILDNLAVADPGQVADIRVFSPSNTVVADLAFAGGFDNWVGSIFAANFAALWLQDNNSIRPSDDPSISVSDNQNLFGYGGSDIIYGGAGNDTITPGLGDNRVAGGDTGPTALTTVTGNDTFVIGAGVAANLRIDGTDFASIAPLQFGEINTIRATGNNDFSLATIHWINKLVYDGATALTFGADQFEGFGFNVNEIQDNSTIVGDAGANALNVDLNPASTFHVSDRVDLSQLTFQSWSANDTVTVTAFQAGGGADIIVGPNVAANLVGGTRADDITGGSANDIITGGANNDTLHGGAGGNDVFIGGAGNDTLQGDGFNDTADYSTDAANGGLLGIRVNQHGSISQGGLAPDTVIDGFGDTDTIDSVRHIIGTQFADMIYGGTHANRLDGGGGNDFIFGHNGGDTLFGRAGNDTLVGGLGADAMQGGNDNDTYDVDVAGDTVTETPTGGTDTVRSSTISLNLASFANVENATLLGSAALSATGNANANGLTGSSNSGANVLTGLGGNDSYTVGAGDTVVEAAGGGVDTVLSSTLSLNLASFANVENATLLGSAALSAIGNAGANGLTGSSNTAANVLTGLAGNNVYTVGTGDTIVEAAGGGTDVVISNLISLSLASFANVENVTLTGALALAATGNASANTLDAAANSAANVLTGLGGNNVYFVGTGDTIVEAAGGGSDTANSSTVSINLGLAAFANVENAQLNGSAALNATGDANANTLYGSTSTGANVLTGLGGNDTFYVGAGDTVIEAAGGGTDTVASNLISLNLASFANVENATLTGVLALSATGNASGNGLTGSSSTAANVLTGLNGNNVYTVGAGDTIVEAAVGGTDVVISSLISLNLASYANVENAWLNGSTAGLNATGNAGVNTITGNAAANTLTGLGAADTFVFNTALGAANIDAVADFSVADDTINLENAVFTTLVTGALAAAAFRIGAAALDADDRIIYNSASGALLYDADGTGATAAQQFATLSAGLAMTSADFTVI